MTSKACPTCGSVVDRKHVTYCSKACMAKGYVSQMRGAANPNYRDAGKRKCIGCGCEFLNYNKHRRYCTKRCYGDSGAQSANARKNGGRRSNWHTPKQDHNHEAIRFALEWAGATVMDMHEVGSGCPDMVAGFSGSNHLLEVKNPKTRHGMSGLTPAQLRWVSGWDGSPVHVVYTVEDALRAIGAIK